MPTPGSASGAVTARRYPGSTTMSLSFTRKTRVARAPRQFRQHADLGIGRGGGNDRDLDAQRGKLALQALDILQRRIVGRVHAEEDFELGIVLRGVRKDGFVEARIASVDRFEDGERRQR